MSPGRRRVQREMKPKTLEVSWRSFDIPVYLKTTFYKENRYYQTGKRKSVGTQLLEKENGMYSDRPRATCAPTLTLSQ